MIRLLIVDSDRLTSHLLASALHNQADMKVIDWANDSETALGKSALKDIALVSASLPEGTALELTRQLKNTGVRVVVTGLVESESLIIAFIEAGAAGYLLLDSSAEELVSTIRAVNRGEALISPRIGKRLVERMNELAAWSKHLPGESPAADNGTRPPLTEREMAVLALVAEGLTNPEIARSLVIELGTVKNHVHNILKKLEVSSRAQAARFYYALQRTAVHGQLAEADHKRLREASPSSNIPVVNSDNQVASDKSPASLPASNNGDLS
jgi:DNA-binding NarL/FixJ family response regulator